MSTTVTTKWTGAMSFDALVTGHHIIMDAADEWGGKDAGPRPKAMLLASLAGCSGMDVVYMLNKMQVVDYTLDIVTDAESTTEHPVIFHTIEVDFRFTGEGIPHDKVIKAVKLSTEKYCGVNAMLGKAATINVHIHVNDQEVM